MCSYYDLSSIVENDRQMKTSLENGRNVRECAYYTSSLIFAQLHSMQTLQNTIVTPKGNRITHKIYRHKHLLKVFHILSASYEISIRT